MEENYIEEAGAKCERIVRELPAVSDCSFHEIEIVNDSGLSQMTETLHIVEGKDACLAGWCRERVSALNGIQTQWEQFQPLIENHSAALKVQIDSMKNQIEIQMANMKDEIEKFEIRWESTINELENNEHANLDSFRDRQQNWSLIKQQREKLENSCQKYALNFPTEIREIFDKMSNEIETQGKQWHDFEEFKNDYNNVCSEEWTVYRRRPYILSDFIGKWNSKIIGENNTASKRVAKLLDSLQTVTPTLQNLQSDGLTEKHWATIFYMMDMPYKAYHDITLKDVLADVNSLNRNATEIQQLVRKASSEQVVRQALTELDQWGVQAELKTFNHIDSSSNSVTIIKDFQEVLNKVRFTRSLLFRFADIVVACAGG